MSTSRPAIPSGLVLEPFRALRFAASSRGDLRLAGPAGGGGGRYAAAAEQLRRWRSDGTLLQDNAASLYCYEITPTDGARVSGLMGAVRLAPAAADIVLPHEDTMSGPVLERLALLEATETDLEPIFLLYDGGPAAAVAVERALAGPVVIDEVIADGSRHRLAVLGDPETLSIISDEMLDKQALIADGHHRYATYLAHQANRWAAGAGAGPWDAGLAFLVDINGAGPRVLPIHRVLHTLPFSIAVKRAARAGRVRPLLDGTTSSMLAALQDAPQPSGLGRAGSGSAFVLAAGAEGVLFDQLDARALAAALPRDRGATWRSLDVTALHRYVIPNVFGVTDDERDVRAEPDPARAVRIAESVGGTAVLLRSASAADVLAVAADGDSMPRKSTRFLPKPASGLLWRPLDLT